MVCLQCFAAHIKNGYFYKCGCECHKKPVVAGKYDAYGHKQVEAATSEVV